MGTNIRTVWRIATQGFPGAHFATFPEKLVEPCILAGTCPFMGLYLDMEQGTVVPTYVTPEAVKRVVRSSRRGRRRSA